MKSHEYYSGREQTYVKHFFLERYLERVAYNIFSFQDEFVYVDGFSGPWQSSNEEFDDTSFVIAINELRKIKTGFAERGKSVRIRCLFIEKDPRVYSNLVQATRSITDIDVQTICGSFEELIPEIVNFVGSSFSLVFIDPTGWTGYGLKKITPLLNLRGEIIINFMFDYINRFIDDPRPETAQTFNPLFGNSTWFTEYSDLVAHGASREDAVLGVYKRNVR
jgi:three-Cys-motif partner protein